VQPVKVVVVDSGVGNLPNAVRGLERAGAAVTVTDRPEVVVSARRIVLPGVGAFPAAMGRLRTLELDVALRRAAGAGAAILGICLGHQLLFEASEEHGHTRGLGLLRGQVVRLPEGERVPHMGWCRVEPRRDDPLLRGLASGPWMYFVHSFVAIADPEEEVATVPFGNSHVCAVARRGRVCGVQFHPEKSGEDGAVLLRNFLSEDV